MSIDSSRRSREAYHVVMSSGLISKRAVQVYCFHYIYGAMGKREMFQRFIAENPDSKVQVDSFGPRYAQLVQAGLMEEVGEHICPYTGVTVTSWDVTTKIPKRKLGKAQPQPGSKAELLVKLEHLTKENAHLRRIIHTNGMSSEIQQDLFE